MHRHTNPLGAIVTALALLAAGPACAKGTGFVFVSSEKDHALAVVDPKTLAVVGTVPTCKRPRHLQRLPDGARMLVACGDSGEGQTQDDIGPVRTEYRVEPHRPTNIKMGEQKGAHCL